MTCDNIFRTWPHTRRVILSGPVKIVDHLAGVERDLVTGGPGEFVAELNLLTGERLFTTAVVAEACAVWTCRSTGCTPSSAGTSR